MRSTSLPMHQAERHSSLAIEWEDLVFTNRQVPNKIEYPRPSSTGERRGPVGAVDVDDLGLKTAGLFLAHHGVGDDDHDIARLA